MTPFGAAFATLVLMLVAATSVSSLFAVGAGAAWWVGPTTFFGTTGTITGYLHFRGVDL